MSHRRGIPPEFTEGGSCSRISISQLILGTVQADILSAGVVVVKVCPGDPPVIKDLKV